MLFSSNAPARTHPVKDEPGEASSTLEISTETNNTHNTHNTHTRVNVVTKTGIAALLVFIIQHSLGTILVRYTMTRLKDQYDSTVAVLMQEVAVKLPLSIILLCVEQRGVFKAAYFVAQDVKYHYRRWIKMTIPSIIYTVQMNALYIGYGNVEVAIGQTIYQSKILFTALCTRLVLKRVLSINQCIALFLLTLGVVIIKFVDSEHELTGKKDQNEVLGSIALLLAAFASAFASVYFESIIKSDEKPSLWLLNIQLAIFGSVVALIGAFSNGIGTWFSGFTPLVWLSIVWQAAGGLVVAMTIKYADNILRCFAQSIGIVLITVISVIFFEFQVTAVFFIGTVFVIASIFLYSSKMKTPMDVLDSVNKMVQKRRGMRQLAGDAGEEVNMNGPGKLKLVQLICMVLLLVSFCLGGSAVIKMGFKPMMPMMPMMLPPPPLIPPLIPPPSVPLPLPPLPSSPSGPPLSPLSPLSPLLTFPSIPPTLPLPSMPPPPFPPLPPSSPDPYEPAGGCEWELNHWCRDTASSHCDIGHHSELLLARYGRGAYGSNSAWRCYQPVCLQNNLDPIHGCHAYCTRQSELQSVLSRCHEGRYRIRQRTTSPVVRRFMIHLDRDGWKLGRFRRSVINVGQNYENLGIHIRPGVIVRDHPEIFDWAMQEGLMIQPSLPNNLGNIGSALAHLTLWDDVSKRPDNETFLIYEDNALQTQESESAIQYFSNLEFDYFNFRVLRPRGSQTSEPGVLRLPNNEIITEQPRFLWFSNPLPNLWLSSYMITPTGAREMLRQFKALQPDLSTTPVDRAAVMALYRSATAKSYIVSHNRYFGHVETGGDTRAQLNNG